MRGTRLATGLAIVSLAFAGCATRSTVQLPQASAPGPITTAPTSGPAAPRCVAGTGQVVRVTGGDMPAASPTQGGVLGGVLGDDGSTPAPDTTPVAHPAGHDIYVQTDDGRKLIVNQHELGGISVGSRVRIDQDCRAQLLR